MSDIQISVGGAFEAEATCRFADALKRAEVGEIFTERHLTFESWDSLARVLTDAGSIDVANGEICAEFDAIETRIAL